jgi:hypothetical protein
MANLTDTRLNSQALGQMLHTLQIKLLLTIKKITNVQYPHIFYLAILGTVLYVLYCGEFEHLSSQNHESLDPLV